MKKLHILSILIITLLVVPAEAQIGKMIKNTTKAVTNDLFGKSNKDDSKNSRPEPSCACDQAELVFEVGKYKIDYSELAISILNDGSVLLQDKMTANLYVVKNGVTEGPLKRDDPRVRQFEEIVDEEFTEAGRMALNKDYFTRQNDKTLITFGGKSYGPYARIEKFEVSLSKNQFAAIVTESIVFTDDETKKMEEAMKNAKTQEEQMKLSMQYSQQVQKNMMAGGGPAAILPKLISNVKEFSQEETSMLGQQLYNTIKFDEILFMTPSGYYNLQGQLVAKMEGSLYNPEGLFISSDNSRNASYSYGTLTFSDGKKLSELFNPHLVKADGKTYLAYMYFSPKSNAIMQCRMQF